MEVTHVGRKRKIYSSELRKKKKIKRNNTRKRGKCKNKENIKSKESKRWEIDRGMNNQMRKKVQTCRKKN